MKFCCDVCPGNIRLCSYSDWIKHLASSKHQIELRKMHDSKFQWPNAENTYVVSGPINEFSFAKLLEWLATFGVVTEFLHDTKYNFCIFTLQSIGNIGNSKEKEVIGDHLLFGKSVLIKPKSEIGPVEWNLLYDAERNMRENSQELDNKSVASTASSSSANSSRRSLQDSTPKTKKTTIVFTNKNFSSKLVDDKKNPNAKVLKPENFMRTEVDNIQVAIRKLNVSESSHGVSITGVPRPANLKDEQRNLNMLPIVNPHALKGSVSSTSEDKSKDGNGKNKKSKKKKMTTLEEKKNEESEQPLYSEVPKELASQTETPGGSKTFPLSHASQVNKMTLDESGPLHEPLNFRGGFTPSRLQNPTVSESNDDGHFHGSYDKVTDVVSAETVSNSSSNKSQSLTEPLKQILQTHLVKATSPQLGTNEGGGSASMKTRVRNESMNTPTPKVLKRKIEAVGQSSRTLNLNSTVTKTPSYATHFLETISPIFFAQVPDSVKSFLVHPACPTKDTYRFSGCSPKPSFFELFQYLGMSSNINHKRSNPKHELFRRFSALQLPMQLQEFMAAQTLASEDMRLRWQFMLDMLYVLREHYPNCELYAFGSILTGLGDYSSDIDVYVDLTGESASPSNNASQKLSSQQALGAVNRILRRSSCPHHKNRFVKNVVAVKSARIPIIKLTHASTHVNCDISFENRLSVQNSKLMTLYIKLDPRVYPLMVLIRFWGKFHQITGSSLIKNYALILLVLVYLVKAKILPPVALLQKLKANERKRNGQTKNPDRIEGWDASFCENREIIKSNFKGSPVPSSYAQNPVPTLIKMAQEFFELYGTTDFLKVVVCTLTGEILAKDDFMPGNEERLQQNLDQYKTWAMQQEWNKRLNIRNTFLCIQDPFLLSFNVGCVTPLGTLLKFQIGCVKTAQVLSNTNNLKSLLDVLIPIPSHIGERKFMRTYKTDCKSEELKREIKLAFGINPGEERKSVQSKPSFVRLPKHLEMFEGLIDEKSMKMAAKKPKWETFIDLTVDKDFESIFITELARCRIKEGNFRLFEIMCSLWIKFAFEFLNEIFTNGLKLEVDTEDSTLEPQSDHPTSKAEGKRSLSKLLSQDVVVPARKNQQQIDLLCKKIMELPSLSSQINYMQMHVNVKYPFWEKRLAIAKKVIAEQMETDLIRVEIWCPSEPNGKKKNKTTKEKTKNGPEVSYFKCLNPIHVEELASDVIIREHNKPDFSPFTFNVLVKLDMSSTNQRPVLILILDEGSQMIRDTTVRAFQTVSQILIEAFPAYQNYCLAKWMDIESVAEDVKPTTLHHRRVRELMKTAERKKWQ